MRCRWPSLVTALPEDFGIVVDPTSAQAANFLQADVLAGLRAGIGGVTPDDLRPSGSDPS